MNEMESMHLWRQRQLDGRILVTEYADLFHHTAGSNLHYLLGTFSQEQTLNHSDLPFYEFRLHHECPVRNTCSN